MKIAEPSPQMIASALRGELASIDALITSIQPGIYNLAVRMLGNREDAADATQEILLKLVTHLSSFRAESAFSTWTFRVAKNHLLTAATKSRESPEVSLEGIVEGLAQGLAFNQQQTEPFGERVLQPDEKLEAKQIALGCTQKMLMSLDRDQRLSYLLDIVFGLSSEAAASVLEISADAHRQRLSRSRARLDRFTAQSCGLVSKTAACRCEKQIPAIRHRKKISAAENLALTETVFIIHPVERDEVQRNFDAIVRLGNASELIKAHPSYQAPDAMQRAIRSVLRIEGFLPANAAGLAH